MGEGEEGGRIALEMQEEGNCDAKEMPNPNLEITLCVLPKEMSHHHVARACLFHFSSFIAGSMFSLSDG